MKPGSLLLGLGLGLVSVIAGAHSASDAYLTLDAIGKGAASGKSAVVVAHGQWDIALRDLDFVLRLDDDADGRITWGELRRHQAQIERYATSRLTFTGGSGDPCSLRVTRQQVDGHADGAYAVLFFDVLCDRRPPSLRMSYDLFFAIDPSHRGILVMHTGEDIATAVLAPENATLNLPL
jgi:hypothetical protein